MDIKQNLNNIKEAYEYNIEKIKYDQYEDLEMSLYLTFENRLREINFLDKAKETINKVENYEGSKLKNNIEKAIKEIQNCINNFQEIKRKALKNCVKNRSILYSMKYSYLENYSKDHNIIYIYNNICKNIIDLDIKFYISNERHIIFLLDNINQNRLDSNI